jgi:hypothetical protein
LRADHRGKQAAKHITGREQSTLAGGSTTHQHNTSTTNTTQHINYHRYSRVYIGRSKESAIHCNAGGDASVKQYAAFKPPTWWPEGVRFKSVDVHGGNIKQDRMLCKLALDWKIASLVSGEPCNVCPHCGLLKVYPCMYVCAALLIHGTTFWLCSLTVCGLGCFLYKAMCIRLVEHHVLQVTT